MRVFKKVLLSILAVSLSAIIMFMSGCSGTEDDIDPSKVNLELWVQLTQLEFFNEVEELFEEENPDINIIVKGKPENELSTSLDGTLSTSNPPDMFSTYGGLVASTLYKSNHLLNLDSVMLPIEDKLIEGAKNNKKDGNGSYVSIPLNGFASPIIFYNKTMFEAMKEDTSGKLTQADKDAVKEPETYDEFLRLCQAVTKYGKQTVVAAFSTWHLPHFMQAIHSRTMSVEDYNKLMDTTLSVNPYDTDAYQDGYKLLKKYKTDGILDANNTAYTTDSINTLFYYEDAAMRMGVSLDFATLNNNVTFDLGAFFLPVESAYPTNPRASAVYSDVVCAYRGTKYPEECKKFLSFVMRADIQSLLADSSLFPSRNDVEIEGKLPRCLDSIYKEVLKGSVDFYQNWSFQAIDLKILEAGTAVLSGSDNDGSKARKLLADFYSNAQSAVS